MGDSAILKLEKNSGIAVAEALGSKLEEYFAAGGPMTIDASEVERVDTSVIQLIYSFITSMTSSGVKVSIVQPSDVFKESVILLGFASYLGIEGSK